MSKFKQFFDIQNNFHTYSSLEQVQSDLLIYKSHLKVEVERIEKEKLLNKVN